MSCPECFSLESALQPSGVYRMVKRYGKLVGISVDRFGPHAARATAATTALDQGADIARTAAGAAVELPTGKAPRGKRQDGASNVQEWLGHANVSTTRVYDHRKTKPEDSPTFKVSY